MSPRNEEENRRIRDERRESILEAAATVFARKGLAATKITDIAAAAGMSHGLVYHYFKSKEEVFTILLDRAIEGATMVTQGAEMQPGTPWERLEWMTNLMVMGVRHQPAYFMVVLQALASGSVPEEVRQKALQQGEIPRLAMVRLIRAGQEAGEVVQGDPEKLAGLFYAAIHGLAASNAFGMGSEEMFPEIDQIMRILKP